MLLYVYLQIVNCRVTVWDTYIVFLSNQWDFLFLKWKTTQISFNLSSPYLIVYPNKWSVCGSTNNDLADSSHALHNAAALSAACISSPTVLRSTESYQDLLKWSSVTSIGKTYQLLKDFKQSSFYLEKLIYYMLLFVPSANARKDKNTDTFN